jgi:mono/diheme cytochrome c family protein
MKHQYLAIPLLALSLGLVSCGGGDKPATDDTTADNTGAPAPTATASGDAAHGQQIYSQTCSPCHGATGKGDGPAAASLNPKPADHSSAAVVGARTDAQLAEIIKMGGSVVGKPTMPPAPQLSEADLKDVVAYMRQLSKTEHH